MEQAKKELIAKAKEYIEDKINYDSARYIQIDIIKEDIDLAIIGELEMYDELDYRLVDIALYLEGEKLDDNGLYDDFEKFTEETCHNAQRNSYEEAEHLAHISYLWDAR